MADVKHKVIVLSGKGGVGKSTVAVNLAMALAAQGKQVGLLDIDLHGPTVPQLLGLSDRTPVIIGETILPIEMGDNLKIMSIGFLLGQPGMAVVWRGPMKAVAIEQFLADVEWGELDYLVVDSPPGTGDEPLAVCQALGEVDGAIIVTTPQETALTNVRRSVDFCSILKLKVLGVIENMAGFACPHCGTITNVFSQGGGASMAAAAKIPFLGSIPLDPSIVEAGDNGRPYISSNPESAAAQAFAKAVIPILTLEEGNGGGKSDAVVAEAMPSSAIQKQGTRFVIPVSDGVLCSHFGHCDQFALIDVDRATEHVLTVESLTPPEHEPGLLPVWLAERGADFIIAGGMGTHAQRLFAEQGIEVVTGAPSLEPEVLVQQYLAGALVTGQNVCDH